MLRAVSGPKSEEFIGEWRKLLREELRGLNSLPDTISVITSKMTREEECINRIGGRT
jgi:hypothetical protein